MGYPNTHDIITQYRQLTGLLDALNCYYEHLLNNDAEALEYCTSTRGILPEAAAFYHLGLAPSVAHVLEFIRLNDLSRDAAFMAGAVLDMFEDRLMFPVYDLAGGIVGYSARAWRNVTPNTPKYVNSPKSPVYWKSLYLYGLWQALPYIDEAGYVLVVEGNMDVISLAQAGIGTVVAPCGTALTEPQLKLLKSLTDKVVFKFDNDLAGKKAAMKAQELCRDLGLQYRTLDLVGAKDPDEYIKKRGVEHVLVEIGKALE